MRLRSDQDGSARDGSAEEFRGDPTVGPRPNFWTRDQRWRVGEAQMQHIDVSPTQRGGAVPAPLPNYGSKWRDKFPEESGRPSPPIVWVTTINREK